MDRLNLGSCLVILAFWPRHMQRQGSLTLPPIGPAVGSQRLRKTLEDTGRNPLLWGWRDGSVGESACSSNLPAVGFQESIYKFRCKGAYL